MLRRLAPLLLFLALGASFPAVEPASADDAVLAAARAADDEFQRHSDLVLAGLSQPDQDKRIQAIRELGRLQDMAAVPRLMPLLEPSHTPIPVVLATLETLADLGATNATAPMLRLLNHENPAVRAATQKSLTRLQAMGAGHYQSRSDDADAGLRASAVTNLGTLKHAEAAPILIKALQDDPRYHVRRMAAIGLGKLGDRAHAPALIEALCDADAGVRRYAAASLVQLRAVEAIPNLLMALEANIAAADLNRSLRLLSGQDFGFDPQGNILERTAAIERGYEWWALNAKTVQAK